MIFVCVNCGNAIRLDTHNECYATAICLKCNAVMQCTTLKEYEKWLEKEEDEYNKRWQQVGACVERIESGLGRGRKTVA